MAENKNNIEVEIPDEVIPDEAFGVEDKENKPNIEIEIPEGGLTDELMDKFRDMANLRGDFDMINPSKFMMPTMGEMLEEDLMYSIYKQINEDINGSASDENKEVLKTAFYSEPIFSTELGYHPDEGVFIVKVPGMAAGKEEWELNKFDGDTYSFWIDEIDAGNDSFTIGGKEYSNFKSYCKSIGVGSKINVRVAGINTPEIPHYEIQPIHKKSYDKEVEKITLKTIKANTNKDITYIYEKFPYRDGIVKIRKDSDEILFLKTEDKKNKKITYNEILKDKTISSDITNREDFNKDYIYETIVLVDETEQPIVAGGYKAKDMAKKKLVGNDKEIYLMLNAVGLTGKRTSGTPMFYNSWWYITEVVPLMIQSWNDSCDDIGLTRLSYSPYGTDDYTRFLGAAFVKEVKGENTLWTNVAKYILSEDDTHTTDNPDYSGSPELMKVYDGLSDAFKIWSYDKNNILWLDSFENLTKKSYEDRIKLHKKLTGIDFEATRECTLMIGDTFVLTPPQNIRNVSNLTYEKIGTLRGKGSLVKNNQNKEQLLEIELYFYGELGINGIEYKTKLPNGEDITYYMNGLRSIISQFKISPFLPIENGYINDILGIEAVSLASINTMNVEGFPGLIKAVLTLREFNYRIYMPDIPVDDKMDDAEHSLAKMNPMFAKCFEWELFRYYYQRTILSGEYTKQLEYGSFQYNEQIYENKNVLQPMKFCNSNMSLWVPDKDWLTQALQVKKDRDNFKQNILPIELTDGAIKFIKLLEEPTKIINSTMDKEINDTNKAFKNNLDKLLEQHNPEKSIVKKTKASKKIDNVITQRETSMYIYKESEHDIQTSQVITDYIEPMFKDVMNEISKSSAIKYCSLGEKETKNTPELLIYELKLYLDTSNLSSSDMISIRETIKNELKLSNTKDILKDNLISIEYCMKFNKEDYSLIDGKSAMTILKTATGMEILDALYDKVDMETGDTDKNENNNILEFNVQDYRNPANMKFVPYLENMEVQQMSVSMSNTFTEMYLKAVDGYAPQYVGGQDTVIEVEMVTQDLLQIAALNTLPSLAIDTSKTYRRIMSCWPIKIKNEMLQMLGVNEVLIDTIDISNMEGFPGVYNIRMRLTSVDRTQRQREALRRIDSNRITTSDEKASISSYWDLESTLSQAELYPDLDIPTLNELGKRGYRFIKYSSQIRTYPDPDFYILYSFPYTAMIIKQMVNDFLKDNLFSKDANENLINMVLEDNVGMALTTKLETTTGMVVAGAPNTDNKEVNAKWKNVEAYDKLVTSASNDMTNPALVKKDYNKETDVNRKDELGGILTYLTACNMQEGWEVKPGWVAPLCEKYTNQAIEERTSAKKDKNKKTPYADDILKLRKEAIELIDDILSKPLTEEGLIKNSNSPDAGISSAVTHLFNKTDSGKKLIKLLNPIQNIDKVSINVTNNKTYKRPDIMNYIAGFAYASACVATGNESYTHKKELSIWQPEQVLWKKNGMITSPEKDKDGNAIPRAKVETISGTGHALSLNEALENGYSFGMHDISLYRKDEIINSMMPTKKTNYVTAKDMPMYINKKKHKEGELDTSSYRSGFIDPYYNYAGHKSKEGKDYINLITTNASCNALAFLRIMLHHLRRQIIDGLFFSELDIIAASYNSIASALDPSSWENQIADDKMSLAQLDTKTIEGIIDTMPDTFGKSFCARMIYPFLSACTNNHEAVSAYFNNRNYDSLNTLTLSEGIGSSSIPNPMDKFLKACKGIGILNSDAHDSFDESTTSNSQKVFNSMMKDVYLTASEDPRIYVMHSFYDMLINDKRGRLVRAFPTYYMLFVDEGRRMGSWKLFDNFYNMSSVSELQVVKSRKIAADTCRFVMSNMYDSYAANYDTTTMQQYVDVYGMRDVFDNIFSPKRFLEKEDIIKRRKELTDKVVLKPGVRIHVRMGYTSDGSKLPVVFNGKIAEVGCDEVVEVIAQGDGHETMNPLNVFGELEAKSLEEAQQNITLFKDLRGSLARGGETPRNLLKKILTARHGGTIKNIIRDVTEDQYFSNNPFGITHFGDWRMNDIFADGEPVQNLYEVCDATLLKGYSELYSVKEAKKTTPIINTTLQDKTLWDLLHMCANSGVEYYGAIRDFGMRSTMFLGKANHYYAYKYAKVDGKLIEKRKPFQQFHYYNSYTDIVYNSIKASEKDIKTNATGIWQSTSPIWGKDQSTVGPVYLDMNIYPEYQKSMTVDTGLIAAGNGGLKFNPLLHLNEKWRMDANDNKVNKALVKRITTNVLRQNLKDMYQGELCVIGDPSVMPYDRIMIHDTYEDMLGQMEVESVVFNLDINTGFTTTITPDLIVRSDDKHEPARQRLIQQFATAAATTIVTRIGLINTLANVESKIARAIWKSDDLFDIGIKGNTAIKSLVASTGLEKYVTPDIDGKVVSPAMAKLFDNLGILPGTNISEISFGRYSSIVDDIGALSYNNKLNLKNADDIDNFLKAINNYNDLDVDEYSATMKKLHATGGTNVSVDDFAKYLDEFEDGAEVMRDMKKVVGNIDVKTFATLVENSELVMNGKHSIEVKNALSLIKSDQGDSIKHLTDLLNDKEVRTLFSSSDEMIAILAGSLDNIDDMHLLVNGATSASAVAGAMKSDDIFLAFKNLFKLGSKFNIYALGWEVAKTVGLFVITGNAKEYLTRWVENIQALSVYPIQKYGRVLVSGINGHRGSVYGYPDNDGWDSIQGMVMKAVEMVDNSLGSIGGFKLGSIITDTFLNRDVYNDTTARWRSNLEISENTNRTAEDFNNELYNSISQELSSKAQGINTIKTRARLEKFDTAGGTSPTYRKYKIMNLSVEDIPYNKNILSLYPIEDDPEIKKAINKNHANIKQLSIAHSTGGMFVDIPFEAGDRQIQYMSNNGIYDLPLLQQDALTILKQVINTQALENQVIHFKSGTRVNSSATWKNTGFSFIIECSDSSALKEALEEVKLSTTFNSRAVFNYSIKDNKASIVIYAPKD